jgi:uncharacterized membrane protein YgcG
MLARIGWWRHAVVAAVVCLTAVLGLLGIVGAGNHPERFDAKHVTVTPVGDDGLRIREVVDQDFGSSDRHGYERNIPLDFGVPTDITASSPDAPAEVFTSITFVPELGAEVMQIRIGDPDTTVSGQHRYVLEYTLPDAHLDSGELALDIIGTVETLETERFEVVVTGLDLADPQCNVGAAGTAGGCTLERDDDGYGAVIAPLEPGDGITIGGTITGRTPPAEVPEPPPIDRRDDRRVQVGATMLGVGVAAAGVVFVLARRAGRNEVFGGGAAEAAFGALSTPLTAAGSGAGGTTRLVTDSELQEMSTIEFAPPAGLSPWHGTVLLSERIDDKTVNAWFSGLISREVIELEQQDGELVMRKGPKLGENTAQEGAAIGEAFSLRDSFVLDGYDEGLSSAWNHAQDFQVAEIAESGWWRRGTPGSGGGLRLSPQLVVFVAIAFVFFFGASVSALVGVFDGFVAAILFAAAASAFAAYLMYRRLLPSRSATGSALALRTESFRRFLEASEGKHVQWAWKKGLLREYSAWAVALGAASAWERALTESGLPRAEIETSRSPLLVYAYAGAFHSARTPPVRSGGGGDGGFGGGFSGGFSGGSVGGGGGGGSSGSW